MGKTEREGVEDGEVCKILCDTSLGRIWTKNGYINNRSLLLYLLICVFIYVFFLFMVHLTTSLVNHKTQRGKKGCVLHSCSKVS
jgi:hypothetical protein